MEDGSLHLWYRSYRRRLETKEIQNSDFIFKIKGRNFEKIVRNMRHIYVAGFYESVEFDL